MICLSQGKKPWHFEITFNPHDVDGGGYVRTMYKSDFDETRPPNPSLPSGSIGPGEGLLSVIGGLTGLGSAKIIAKAVGLLVKNNLPVSSWIGVHVIHNHIAIRTINYVGEIKRGTKLATLGIGTLCLSFKQ